MLIKNGEEDSPEFVFFPWICFSHFAASLAFFRLCNLTPVGLLSVSFPHALFPHLLQGLCDHRVVGS